MVNTYRVLFWAPDGTVTIRSGLTLEEANRERLLYEGELSVAVERETAWVIVASTGGTKPSLVYGPFASEAQAEALLNDEADRFLGYYVEVLPIMPAQGERDPLGRP